MTTYRYKRVYGKVTPSFSKKFIFMLQWTQILFLHFCSRLRKEKRGSKKFRVMIATEVERNQKRNVISTSCKLNYLLIVPYVTYFQCCILILLKILCCIDFLSKYAVLTFSQDFCTVLSVFQHQCNSLKRHSCFQSLVTKSCGLYYVTKSVSFFI